MIAMLRWVVNSTSCLDAAKFSRVANRSTSTDLVVNIFMDAKYEIYFSHGDDGTRPVVTEMLKAIGHRVGMVTSSGQELIDAVAAKRPDLLISGVRLSDMDGIDALIECSKIEPLPSIIISRRTDQAKVEHALEDHVMAYLAEPVQQSDLRPSIFLVMQRFAQFQQLREENAELKEALQIRKWVERAKGLLMKQHDIDEDTAYKRLQRMASDQRTKMSKIAKAMIEPGDDFGD